MITDNIVMWATQLSIVDWVYFKTQTLLATLKTQNQPLGETCVSSEVEHLFPSVGCARGKLLSRTESEIISLDAGLRMDGILALDLWNVVIDVLRSTNNTVKPNHDSIRETSARPNLKTKTPTDKRKQEADQLSDVDHVPTNTHSSQGESHL